jgi:hypothetical protein
VTVTTGKPTWFEESPAPPDGATGLV